MVTLKTKRTPILPIIPDEDAWKDYEDVLAWRKGHLTVLQQLHADVCDDLTNITGSNVANHNPVTVLDSGTVNLTVTANQLLYAAVTLSGIHIDTLANASNITTLNANANTHGLCPRLSGNALQYLNGNGAFSVPAGSGGDHDAVTVTDTASVNMTITANQVLSAAVLPGGVKLDDWATPDDNTDLNVSTTRHGLCPKRSGVSSEYLTGAGTWTQGNFACAMTLFPWELASNVGTWAFSTASSQLFNGFYYNTTSNVGDCLSTQIWMNAGSYAVSMLGIKGANSGVLSVAIDSVSKMTFDFYNATTAYNQYVSNNFTVAVANSCLLELKVINKNVLSSDYFVYISQLSIKRYA